MSNYSINYDPIKIEIHSMKILSLCWYIHGRSCTVVPYYACTGYANRMQVLRNQLFALAVRQRRKDAKGCQHPFVYAMVQKRESFVLSFLILIGFHGSYLAKYSDTYSQREKERERERELLDKAFQWAPFRSICKTRLYFIVPSNSSNNNNNTFH